MISSGTKFRLQMCLKYITSDAHRYFLIGYVCNWLVHFGDIFRVQSRGRTSS